MNIEIERKFLIKNLDFIEEAKEKVKITQGFLSSAPERTVRVRLKGEKGFLTIKGIGNESGTTRFEFEKEISKQEAKDLLKICEVGIIEKVRHFVFYKKHRWEVDIFKNQLEGLCIAEIELTSENEKFEKPSWLGEEVTGRSEFYNSSLSKVKYWKV